MTKNIATVKSVLTRAQFDVGIRSTWLSKDKLSDEAFEELSVYLTKKQFKLAFVIRDVCILHPVRSWGKLPEKFYSSSKQTAFENVTEVVPFDKDFIYVQYSLDETENEQLFMKFINDIKNVHFKNYEKHIWLGGVKQ